MKSNSGEVVLGLVIGLAIGAALLYVKSGELAQQRANATGVAVSQWDVITETPGKSTLTVIAPAAAGAGVGWLLEEVSGGSDEKDSGNNVEIQGDGNNVFINRDDANNSVDNSDNSSTGGF